MICYAKVSSNSDIESLKERLESAGFNGADMILDTEARQKAEDSTYSRLKETLAERHNPLLLDSLASLGKNAREITKELKWFADHDVEIYVLDMPSTMAEAPRRVDILYDANRIYAEQESARIKAGQEESRKKQSAPGRPRIPYPVNWDELYARWDKKEVTSAQFMEATGLSQGTFYNLLRRFYSEQREAEKSGGKSERLA